MRVLRNGLFACSLLAIAIAGAPSPAQAEERHAGTVLSVDPVARTITIEEFGVGAVRRTFTVPLASDASLARSERNRSGSEFDRPFIDTPIRLGDVAPGDFVVVELDPRDVATSVTITQRGGA